MRLRQCAVANVVFAIFVALPLAYPAAPTRSKPPKFKVLHTFQGPEGAAPNGQLIRDTAGNLYGTAQMGGSGKCKGSSGCGTAFELSATGSLRWSHSFSSAGGETPAAGLRADNTGNFYGTTEFGGHVNPVCSSGCGVGFRLDSTGKETVLHKFTGTPDGYDSQALLVEDSAGNLYGTSYLGGAYDAGAVFKITKAGKETVLYSFTGYSDGCYPVPGVILDASGNLYGVASDGGSADFCTGYGVVFKLDTSGNQTVLHTFGFADGANPSSVLLFDSTGNLYGTTESGGNGKCAGAGCGVIFELSPQSGGNWSETVLYTFCSSNGCSDGATPTIGPLVMDVNGNLYGTTFFGGSRCNASGCGVVFKLNSTGKETVLHHFLGTSDGAYPWGGLTIDGAGNLYGAARSGGGGSCNVGCGTVFEITR